MNVTAIPVPPRRPAGAHKNDFGHLLIIAGSKGRDGAAILAAQGALYSGVGLCTLYTKGNPEYAAALPELMSEHTSSFDPEALGSMLAGKAAVVFGPGAGTGADSLACLRHLLVNWRGPLLLDADAFTLLAGMAAELADSRARLVLTPHPGELSALLQVSKEVLCADRIGWALRAASTCGAVLVLKGAGTVVADHDGRCFVNASGSSALARAGSGDVLAGLTGGLMAQGMDGFDAAVLGVHAHGLAGEAVAGRLGSRGALGSNVARAVAGVLDRLEGEGAKETRR